MQEAQRKAAQAKLDEEARQKAEKASEVVNIKGGPGGTVVDEDMSLRDSIASQWS